MSLYDQEDIGNNIAHLELKRVLHVDSLHTYACMPYIYDLNHDDIIGYFLYFWRKSR